MIPYLPLVEQDDLSVIPNPTTLIIGGTGYTSNDYFHCIIQGKHMHTEVQALFVSTSELSCVLAPKDLFCKKLPCFIRVRVVMRTSSDSVTSLGLHGSVNIKMYAMPVVQKISPNLGTVAGGTSIIVEGTNFNSGYGRTYCVFGEQEVEAKILVLGTNMTCTAPPNASINTAVDFTVSIDGLYHKIGHSIKYLYIADVITFDDV